MTFDYDKYNKMSDKELDSLLIKTLNINHLYIFKNKKINIRYGNYFPHLDFIYINLKDVKTMKDWRTILNHEHIHRALNHHISLEACEQFDYDNVQRYLKGSECSRYDL